MSERPPQHQDGQPGIEHRLDPTPDFEPRFPGSGRLKDKVAIITGGDSGIGRACAILFAREGARLCLVYRDEEQDARTTRELVEREGGEALLISGDVSKPDFCLKAVEETVNRFGRLDILINNAAEQHPSDHFETISAGQLHATFATNMFGYFFMAQEAMRQMSPGAAIVNTTSVTAYRGSHHLIDYASTKGAITAFTRSLAQYGAKKGIRVNGVAPGPIWTPLIAATFPADKVADFGSDQPMGRAGQPNEVASSHLFLACEDSSYMTGQVLHPNGGEIVGG